MILFIDQDYRYSHFDNDLHDFDEEIEFAEKFGH